MDGSRLLVDTNIILYALKGDMALTELIDGQDLFISFITRIELLSFPGIDKPGIALIEHFLEQIPVIESNPLIIQTRSSCDEKAGLRYRMPSLRPVPVSWVSG